MSYNFDHYPDMNHDGHRDSRDSALFHEMMDEDARSYQRSSHSSGSGHDVSTKSILTLLGVMLVVYFIAKLIFG